MLEKYNLEKMLEEIKEDEKLMERSKGSKASQDMIRKMMMERLKKNKTKNE